MIEIKLKNENIEQVEMITEFINWTCPKCGKKHRTIEWVIKEKELFCTECLETVKYSWE